MDFKLCILAAGRGTRVNSYNGLHKALLPVGNRAVISRIINLFPNVPVVIAVGYKAEQIKSYLDYILPNRHIEYVTVGNFSGEGSGPGLSLLQCKDQLQCPFVFTSADTLVRYVNEPIEPDNDWVGVCEVDHDDGTYCTFDSKLGYGNGGLAYIGMAGVFSYENFWHALARPKLTKGEHQVIDGLNALHLHPKVFPSWMDTGNDKAYAETRKKFNETVEAKNDEAIFIEEDKVVKFFADPQKVSHRTERAEILSGMVPAVTHINENMYGYDYVEGKCLSDVTDEKTIDAFFSFVKASFPIIEEMPKFRKDCTSMHVDKFVQRSRMMGDLEKVTTINGVRVPSMSELREKMDFELVVRKAVPTRFHGDLQPENIICDGDKFTLIDWRDCFGGSLSSGDLYYDLGKLWHAIVVNGHIVRKRMFSVDIEAEKATVTIHYRSNLMTLMCKFKSFCKENDYDWGHIVLLGIMQFIGIAPLHEEPYSTFLYLYGKLALTKKLKGEYELE